jgi:hypothetical protein
MGLAYPTGQALNSCERMACVPEYIAPLPPSTDPDEIAGGAFDRIRDSFPNYDPRESQLATIVIVALSLRIAEVADLVPMIPKSIFRYFGSQMVGLPPDDGGPATATVTIYTRDTAGYTVEAGTELTLEDADGDDHLFALRDNAVIPAGSTSLANVVVESIDDGTVANNITAGTAVLVDSLDYVVNITQQGTSSGGTDPEDDDTYINRVALRVGLIPRPTTAPDFSALTLVTFPDVYRSLAIDNYAPGTNQTTKLDFGGTITGGTYTITVTAPGLSAQATNPITWVAGDQSATIQAALEALPAIDPGEAVVTLQAGTPNDYLITFGGRWAALAVTVAVSNALTGTAPTLAASTFQAAIAPNAALLANVTLANIDVNGNALSAPLKAQIDAFLQAQREFGFVVNVIDPTYTNVDVSFSFTTEAGSDATATRSGAEQAVRDYLNPATFGSPSGDARGWSVQTKVYLWELITVVNNFTGVDRVTALTIGANGGTQAATDLTLTGSIPLPRPGSVIGTPV